MEKEVAIKILEDIKECLYADNWKPKTLSTVRLYKKNLLIATNEDLKNLAKELKKYPEDSEEYVDVSGQMADIMHSIYNS